MDLSNTSECDLLISDDTDALVRALSALSPSSILSSSVLRSSFQQFFERGTPENCWQLLPEKHKSFLLSSSKSKSRGDSNRTNTRRVPNLSDRLTRHFKKLVGPDDDARVQRLVNIAKDLSIAQDLPDAAYGGIWPAKPAIFGESELDPTTGQRLPRQRRLYDGRGNISVGSDQYGIADRLSLLFVATEVDLACLSFTSKLPSGQGRKTFAFDQVATYSGVPLKRVKDDTGRSRTYLEYFVQAGPGALLEIGRGTANDWEKHMKMDDVRLVHEYRTSVIQDLSERAKVNIPIEGETIEQISNSIVKERDIVASKVIVLGLIRYGWTWDEILSSKAPFICKLSEHLFTHGYTLHMIQEEASQGLSFNTQPSSARRLSLHPSIQNRPQNSKKRQRNCTSARDEENLGFPLTDSDGEGLDDQNTRAARQETDLPATDPWMVAHLDKADRLQHFLQEAPDPWMTSNLRGADSLQHFLEQNLDPGMAILGDADNLQNLSQQSSRFGDLTLPPAPDFLQQAPDFAQQQAPDFSQLAPDPNMAMLREGNSLQFWANDRTPGAVPTPTPWHSREGAHRWDQHALPLPAVA